MYCVLLEAELGPWDGWGIGGDEGIVCPGVADAPLPELLPCFGLTVAARFAPAFAWPKIAPPKLLTNENPVLLSTQPNEGT